MRLTLITLICPLGALFAAYGLTSGGAFTADDEHLFISGAQSLAQWRRLEAPQVYGNSRFYKDWRDVEPARPVLGAALVSRGDAQHLGRVQAPSPQCHCDRPHWLQRVSGGSSTGFPANRHHRDPPVRSGHDGLALCQDFLSRSPGRPDAINRLSGLRAGPRFEWVFEPAQCAPGHSPAPTDFRAVQQVDKGHGRIEKRTLTVSSLLAETSDWPGLAQVFKLQYFATTLHGELLWSEVVYGLTSLAASEASPADLLKVRRQEWAIESQLHYRRNVTLGEDACRCKHTQLAQAFATLNKLVLALLLRNQSTNAAQAQRYYAAHPDHALNLLLRAPFRL